ncbi:hypothetical protein SUGI_0555470 [Cryptomeria japonica]|nr:hypothetical protein SUGI_0555470 [Cryptomeria japonica]
MEVDTSGEGFTKEANIICGAIMREEKWPLSFRCDGHLISEKMSKSTGNFKTSQQAIEAAQDEYRLSCGLNGMNQDSLADSDYAGNSERFRYKISLDKRDRSDHYSSTYQGNGIVPVERNEPDDMVMNEEIHSSGEEDIDADHEDYDLEHSKHEENEERQRNGIQTHKKKLRSPASTGIMKHATEKSAMSLGENLWVNVDFHTAVSMLQQA